MVGIGDYTYLYQGAYDPMGHQSINNRIKEASYMHVFLWAQEKHIPLTNI